MINAEKMKNKGRGRKRKEGKRGRGTYHEKDQGKSEENIEMIRVPILRSMIGESTSSFNRDKPVRWSLTAVAVEKRKTSASTPWAVETNSSELIAHSVRIKRFYFNQLDVIHSLYIIIEVNKTN